MGKVNTGGIHHITAITHDPQKNLDFYEGFLGQKLTKKTLNYDDPHAYHLYYGDMIGTFGTLITFFYWKHLPKRVIGKGEVSEIYYAIPENSIEFWKNRAQKFNILNKEETLTFGEKTLIIYDPDGIKIGLIEIKEKQTIKHWQDGPIPQESALLGFYGAKIMVHKKDFIESTLVKGLGYEELSIKDTVTLYKATGSGYLGKYLIVEEVPSMMDAHQGYGSVHHIAFQTKNDSELNKVMEQIHDLRIPTTGFVDRQYFHSVYFRTHANILFELATNHLGLTVDGEKEKMLGEKLIIPPHYKDYTEEINKVVIPLNLPRNNPKWKE